MASYSVEWTRPTVYLDNAGAAVKGYQVRITLYPWNEARDIELPDATPEAIAKLAEIEVKKRANLDKLSEIEVEVEE